jgi:hypothetical protein
MVAARGGDCGCGMGCLVCAVEIETAESDARHVHLAARPLLALQPEPQLVPQVGAVRLRRDPWASGYPHAGGPQQTEAYWRRVDAVRRYGGGLVAVWWWNSSVVVVVVVVVMVVVVVVVSSLWWR